jgi:hypothetical protein
VSIFISLGNPERQFGTCNSISPPKVEQARVFIHFLNDCQSLVEDSLGVGALIPWHFCLILSVFFFIYTEKKEEKESHQTKTSRYLQLEMNGKGLKESHLK